MHRIERPLFVDLPGVFLLREAISAAQRRAYFQQLARLRKQIAHLDKTSQRALARELQATRRAIVSSIADATGFKAVHLRELSAEFDLTLQRFGARYGAIMTDALQQGADLGKASVAGPLNATGQAVSVPMLSPEVMEAANLMSADLITGITTSLKKSINREVRLVSMGVKTPHEAIGAIGRNLKDPSVFRTVATRAETILRTETGRIRSMAFLADLEDVKDVVPGIKKQWLWSGIGREEHAELNGKKIDPDDDFVDGYGNSGPAPRMFGAPESDINCGCEAIVVIDEEASDVPMAKTPSRGVGSSGSTASRLKEAT